jgi:hypothetical protein
MRIIVLLLVLAGCAAQEERDCVEFKAITFERERCVPFYGSLICATEEVTELRCIRYDDKI